MRPLRLRPLCNSFHLEAGTEADFSKMGSAANTHEEFDFFECSIRINYENKTKALDCYIIVNMLMYCNLEIDQDKIISNEKLT